MALARMKRLFIVGLEDEKEKTMRFLQSAGVVHVEPLEKMSYEAEKVNTGVLQDAKRVGQVYEALKGFGKAKVGDAPPDLRENLLSACEEALEALQEVRNRKKNLQKLIKDLSVWGDFRPEYLAELEREGVFVQRFSADGIVVSEMSLPDDVYWQAVSEKPTLQLFTISVGHPVELPWATQLRRPEKGLEEAKGELKLLIEREDEIIRTLSALAARREDLKRMYVDLLNKANFAACLGSLYGEGLLFGLQGWIPEDSEKDFFDQLGTSGLAVIARARDPLDEEEPPTLLKNNWFFQRIEPLLKLYGIPGYRDIDPSYFFAPFMILFFGICLGDAGYGAVFLLASLVIRKRLGHLSPSLPLVMKLCEAFSISAIVIGLLSGSVFGYWWLPRDWIVVDLDKDYGDPMVLFYASLCLGVIHLSLSYVIGILQSLSGYGKLQKLGQLGVLWGGSCLIAQRIWFTDPSATAHSILFYGGTAFLGAGVLLTFLFASHSRHLLKRIGLGLWNVYGLVSMVGDLLSYARLFGLGIATTAIASVMNDLARMVQGAAGSIVGGALSVLILVFGHTFNLLLSILGSTVHSARLHFVEAFKNFFESRGVEYKPFKVERG